jgi:hypothetical protein
MSLENIDRPSSRLSQQPPPIHNLTVQMPWARLQIPPAQPAVARPLPANCVSSRMRSCEGLEQASRANPCQINTSIKSHRNPPVINTYKNIRLKVEQNQHLQKNRGEGGPSACFHPPEHVHVARQGRNKNVALSKSRLTCFQALTDICHSLFCTAKMARSLFSIYCALFAQNTRGGGGYTLNATLEVFANGLSGQV